jgi:DNA-binding NtrC family response regulator
LRKRLAGPGGTAPRARKVLVVDDEPDIVGSLRVFLRYALQDVEVRTATSAAQALEVLHHEPVDLVVADYRMPGMDGLQLLEAVGRLAPGVPRIIFTGHWDPAKGDPPKAADRVLPKSGTLEELIEGVRGLLSSCPAAPARRPPG